jgi:small GTP-binding protein
MAVKNQPRSRVVVVGDSSVGKTSILTSLMGDTFNPYEQNTVGANWHLHTEEFQGERIQLQIWDTAGQERYRSLGPLYYRNAVVAIVVYDITNPESFGSLSGWIDAYRAVAGPNGCVFVVGNKTDLEANRQVTFDEASDWAKVRGYVFYETSAKTAYGVTNLFRAVAAQVAASRKQIAGMEEPKALESKGCC